MPAKRRKAKRCRAALATAVQKCGDGESPTLAILFSFSGYAHQAVHSPLPRERIKVRAQFVSSRGLGQLSGGIFLRTLLDRTDIGDGPDLDHGRSEEHTSELQSHHD